MAHNVGKAFLGTYPEPRADVMMLGDADDHFRAFSVCALSPTTRELTFVTHEHPPAAILKVARMYPLPEAP